MIPLAEWCEACKGNVDRCQKSAKKAVHPLPSQKQEQAIFRSWLSGGSLTVLFQSEPGWISRALLSVFFLYRMPTFLKVCPFHHYCVHLLEVGNDATLLSYHILKNCLISRTFQVLLRQERVPSNQFA